MIAIDLLSSNIILFIKLSNYTIYYIIDKFFYSIFYATNT